MLVTGGPVEEVVDRPGVDDPVRPDPGLGHPGAAVRLPGELAGRVGVGVDRDLAAHLVDHRQQPAGRVETLGPAVHLDGLVELTARGEDSSASNVLSLRPLPTMSRPVQWPRMSMCGLATAPIMRAVIASVVIFLAAAEDKGCDLIVMSSHGRSGLSSF